jgi:hypothetical protein
MDPLTTIERDDLEERPRRPATGLPVLTGLLATVGGAAVGVGLFQSYAKGISPLHDTPGMVPDWRLHLGLAIALAAFGVATMLFARTAFGRTCLGALAAPGVLLATVNAALGLQLDGLVRGEGFAAIGLGGWLVLGGSAAGLLAALLALGQLGGRGETAAGWPASMLAVLGIGGLLYGWLVGVRVGPDSGVRIVGGSTAPVPATSYFQTLTNPDVRGWSTAVLVAGLSLVVGAVGVATGRRGAIPAGVVFGAAVAVAVDAAVRLFQLRAVPADGAPGAGLVRNNTGLIAYGASAVLLLLLAVMLPGRRPTEGEDARPVGLEPETPGEFGAPGTEYGEPGYGGPRLSEPSYGESRLSEPSFGGPGLGGSRYGAGLDYEPDEDDQPYQPRPFEQPRYLSEHDPARGSAYPLVPDERAARHPAPPRSGLPPEE